MRHSIVVSLSSLLSLAAWAEPPAAVTSADQLREVCHQISIPLAQAAQTEGQGSPWGTERRVTLAPGQFRLTDIDQEAQSLSVDTSAAFHLFHNAAVIYPVDQDDIDLRVADGDPWPAHPERASLELVFRPGQITDAPCSISASPSHQVVLGVEVVSARLVDESSKTLAAMEEDPGLAREGPTTGAPQIELDPSITETSPALAKRVTDAAQGARDQLLGCYQKALAQAPGLNGSQVIGFSVAADGAVSDVVMVADSVQSDDVAACVTSIFGHLKVAPAPKGPHAQALEPGSIALRFSRR